MPIKTQRAAGGRSPAVPHFAEPAEWIAWRERHDRPIYQVTLWPNRSSSPGLRLAVLWLAGIGLAVPLIPALGSPVFWGLLPFLACALGSLWLGLRRSDAAGRLSERLTLWADEVRVERIEPNGRVRRWRADPYWLRLTLHDAARIENYLTLRGGGRMIELGAFLGAEERVVLAGEINAALGRALGDRSPAGT